MALLSPFVGCQSTHLWASTHAHLHVGCKVPFSNSEINFTGSMVPDKTTGPQVLNNEQPQLESS